MKIKLDDVTKINSSSYTSKMKWKYANYLDTGNITEDIISDIQYIDLEHEKLPDRAKRLVHYNSIIYSTVRPIQRHYGIIKEQPENFLVSTGFIVIDANESKIDPAYLYFYLSQDTIVNHLQTIAQSSVSSYPSIRPSDICDLEIDLPSLSNQKQIGNFLYTIISKIENNNKINSELESLAKTIYDYWFLQFDFPNEEGKPYKSSGGAMEYDEQLKMDIPKGWGVRKLCEIATITTGKEDANHSSPDGKYPFFTCSHDISRCDDFKFEGKAILIAGNGDFNMKYYDGKFNAYQRTYVIMPNDDSMSGLIYLTILKNSKKFLVGSNGSIEKFIRKGDIENIFVPVPSNGANYRIFNTFLDQIQLLQKENDELSSLRDYLLPLLMNGQVGFKDE